MDVVTLGAAKSAAKREAETPQTGLGLLGYAENSSLQGTTVSTAAVAVGFCIVSIEPSARDVYISWEARVGVVTAPGGTYGGSLDGIVWEMTMTGSTPVATEIDRNPVRVDKDAPINLNHGKAKGEFRIGPTTTRRTFALGAGLTKDNAGGLLVGQIRNQPSAKSWIKAEAK